MALEWKVQRVAGVVKSLRAKSIFLELIAVAIITSQIGESNIRPIVTLNLKHFCCCMIRGNHLNLRRAKVA
jgi:hypothetical protein